MFIIVLNLCMGKILLIGENIAKKDAFYRLG
jgi:hypothetical protein